DHPRSRQGRARRRLHPGDHRRPLPPRRGRAVGGRARGHRARARHRPGAGRARHAAGDCLALVEQRLRNRPEHPLHRAVAGRGHGRQRAETADARPWRGRADAGDPARRARRHGDRRHPRHVRRRHAARARLPDLHGLGREQSGRPATCVGRWHSVGRLKRVPDVSPKRSLRRALAVLAPLFLGACAVGPDFTRPSVPWLESWSAEALEEAQQEAATQRPVQIDQWWREFGDPVLEKIVEEALRLNPGVRTAGLRILEARAELGIAGSGLYPQLQQLSGDGLWVGTKNSDGRDREFWSGSTGLDIVWELDFWGKFRRGVEAADAEYLASIAQYDDLQVLVAAEAASFYADIPPPR